jgi:hypothetical protein
MANVCLEYVEWMKELVGVIGVDKERMKTNGSWGMHWLVCR